MVFAVYCFFVWKVITNQSTYLIQIDFNPETFGTFEEEKDIVVIFIFTVHVFVRLFWRHQLRQRSVLHVLVLGSEIKAHSLIWATTWQNQQSGCASNEDSDQPGHPPSLRRVFAVRMKKAWVLSYPMSAQRRLWSDWADAQADLSLCWAHTHFVGFVMSRLILFRSKVRDNQNMLNLLIAVFRVLHKYWHLISWVAASQNTDIIPFSDL